MGLQINTNVGALNAYRNLNSTQGSMQTSLERLSSGLRINRAADDAAGLAISEKLRAQVNGLNQAQANAQDGVSLIQTAEGALNETHAILQRMRTLAVQASSDTNTSTDRQAIQLEIKALATEIDSTTERTQFNGMNLLDGTFNAKKLQIGANSNQSMDVSVTRMDSEGLGLQSAAATLGVKGFQAASTEVTGISLVKGSGTTDVLPESGVYKIAAAATTGGNLRVLNADGKEVGTLNTAATAITFASGAVGTIAGGTLAANDSFSIGTQDFSGTSGTTSVNTLAVSGASGRVDSGTYKINTATSKVTDGMGREVGTFTQLDGTVPASVKFNNGSVLTLKEFVTSSGVGAAVGNNGTFTVTGEGTLDLSTRQGAQDALKAIDSAIGKLSDQRAQLGALQNRLDHTIKNLGVSSENLAASESRIRDTDMAKEMTNFTRSQILQQAGVSMLAQANQSSQSVLKLLG